MTEDSNDEDSYRDMRPDLRERREETWDLLVVKGLKYGDVVERLATKYDVTEGAIEYDISEMDTWLPKIDVSSMESGVSRLRELRQNRQRLQQMAMEARQDGDRDAELSIRRRLDKAIELDVKLSQSLGVTEKEPDEVELGWREYMESAEMGDNPDKPDDFPPQP